jgi:transposase
MVRARIPEHIVSSIEDDYFIGKKPLHIAERHPEVSQSTVYNLCQSLREFGAAYPIHRWAPIGRPRLILPSIELELLELLAARSTYYLDELQYHILTEHNLWVSESTVS